MSEKGTCYICKKEFAKNSFTKHLKKCIETKNQDGKENNYTKRNVFLIKIEDQYNPNYFLFVLMDVKGTFRMMDDFLRGIWLECCGHLSSFYVDYHEFIVDYEENQQEYDEDFVHGMDHKLEQVLDVADAFTYTYDFGSSTDLKLSIKSYYQDIHYKDAITVIARNNKVISDLDNSPRSGVCGYSSDEKFEPSRLALESYPSIELEDEYDDEWDDEAYGEEGFNVDEYDEEWNEDDDYEDEEMDALFNEKMEDFLQSDRKNSSKYFLTEDKSTLEDCLTILTVEEIKELARKRHIKGASNARKAPLIKAISKVLSEHYMDEIGYMTDEKLLLLKEAVAHQGVVVVDKNKYNFFSRIEILNLIYAHIMFPVQSSENNRVILRLPKELYEVLKTINLDSYNSLAKRNTEIVGLVRGYTFYYGVIPLLELHEMIHVQLSKTIDLTTFVNVLDNNSIMDSSYYISESLVAFGRVFDLYQLWSKIQDKSSKNSSLSYKRIEKQDLLNVTGANYYIRTKEVRTLEKYIQSNFFIHKNELEEMIMSLMLHLDFVDNPQSLFESFFMEFEIQDKQQAEELLVILVKVYNKNRQWTNKGHSPSELTDDVASKVKTEKNNVLPFHKNSYLPIHPVAQKDSALTAQKDSTLTTVDFVKKVKISRNDLCPCGSGLKHKHCCGK